MITKIIKAIDKNQMELIFDNLTKEDTKKLTKIVFGKKIEELVENHESLDVELITGIGKRNGSWYDGGRSLFIATPEVFDIPETTIEDQLKANRAFLRQLKLILMGLTGIEEEGS